VNQDNVVPFERPLLAGLARRGSPDKSRPRAPEMVELECPSCAAVLCLESAFLLFDSEILCAGCNGTIPVGRAPERVDIQR